MAGARPDAHPLDVLTREHRVICAVLDAIEAEICREDAPDAFRPEFWRGAVQFIEDYADRCHHGKEEDVLFPLLADAGLPVHEGPIGVMNMEHVRGREIKLRIRAATDRGDARAVLEAARDYVELLREHIDKEDHCLFGMARDLLGPERADRLAREFDRVDRELGDAYRQRCLELAGELCAQAGVPFEVASGRP